MKGSIGGSMKLHSVWEGTPLYNSDTMRIFQSLYRVSQSKVAEMRGQVLSFHSSYGTRATLDAYGVSRRTLFRWKKRVKDQGGRIEALIPDSTCPHTKRKMSTHVKIISYIKKLREDIPHLGKEKIKPLLDDYCVKEHLTPIAISTIGKVIKRYHLHIRVKRIYHSPASGWNKTQRAYKQKVKRSPRPTDTGYIEIDTIAKFVHHMKLYIFNAVDVKAKFQFSYGYTRLNSQNGKDFLLKLQAVYPLSHGLRTIQTDNGLEFMGDFHAHLEDKQIPHLFIYPRCPKINGFIERANRTLTEEFIDGHESYFLEGITTFNQSLMDYLIWYNTKRVHKSLGNITPIDYLLSISPPECHMYVTHTFT